jgi:hypothetical protein
MALKPEEIIRDLLAAHAALEALADEMEAAIGSSFAQIERALWPIVRDFMQDGPEFAAMTEKERSAWWAANRDKLDEMLTTTGYGGAVGEYMRRLPEVARVSGRIMVIGGAENFDGFRPGLIREFSDTIRHRFTMLGADAHIRLEATFYDAVVTGRIKSKALGDIRGVITGSYPWGNRTGLYEWHAGTYYRTAHFQASRKLMAAEAKEAGLDRRLYLGPFDAKTRTFCQRHIGHTYTVEEIEQMDNGQTGPVITDGGGWNCRHQWDPVSTKVADALDDEQYVEMLRAA